MGSKKTVCIDGLNIGGNNPVRVESMLKTPLADVEKCIDEINALAGEGCELARVSFPDLKLEDNLRTLIQNSGVKIMTDIHFNYKLALAALGAGCKSVRINPGNMNNVEGTKEVIRQAKDRGAVIRIGANGGSLDNRQMEAAGGDRAAALVQAVEEQINILHDEDFDDMIISAKSSSISETLRANAILSQRHDNPLHIGITEAGPGMRGIVKGSVGIGSMLLQGIGDTLRVSLTGPNTEEVKVGYQILRSLNIRVRGYNLVSCPTCGRRRIDVAKMTGIVTNLLPSDTLDGVTIAVMGCEVNGPREAASADLGIAGSPDGFLIFKHGKYFASVKECDFEREFIKIVDTIR